jgi:D-mannonate dehydratase
LFPFGIGTTDDVFQAVGNFPERIDMFMSFVIPGAMLVAVRFSIVPDIPSGPLDFVVSIDTSISRISSSTHRSSSGQDGSVGCKAVDK